MNVVLKYIWFNCLKRIIRWSLFYLKILFFSFRFCFFFTFYFFVLCICWKIIRKDNKKFEIGEFPQKLRKYNTNIWNVWNIDFEKWIEKFYIWKRNNKNFLSRRGGKKILNHSKSFLFVLNHSKLFYSIRFFLNKKFLMFFTF